MIRSRRPGRWVPSLLAGALAAAMLAAAFSEWRAGLEPVAIGAGPAPAGGAAAPEVPPQPAIALDPAQAAAVLERPVFSPTRRRPEARPAAPKAGAQGPAATARSSEPPPPQLRFTLVGILRDGAGALAVLKPPDGQPAQALRAGQALDGWTLQRIGVDRASFRNGSFERELVLDFRHGPAAKP